MADESLTPPEWGDRFSRVRGHFVSLTDEVEHLLRRVLSDAKIQYAQMEARTKSVDSFTDKIVRKNEKYTDPVAEITDLSGLRVITYYPTDVASVGALIEREFRVDWDHSHRQEPGDEPDRFGYRSDHYVVKLSTERCALPEWQRFAGQRVEIQVRTVMQHAWAAVDHKIRYKDTELPADLRRRLYRLSALLEVADDQFASLQRASDELSASYAASVARGDLTVNLDALSIRAFLHETKVGQLWASRALELGFEEPTSTLELGPEEQAVQLLEDLQLVGIRDLQDFQALMASAEEWGQETLGRVLETSLASAGPEAVLRGIWAYPEDVLSLLVFCDRATEEIVAQTRFRSDIQAGIKASLRSRP